MILFSFFSNCIDTSTYFKDIFTEEKKVLVFKAFKIVRYPYKERIASMNKTNKRLIMIIDGSIYKEKDQESGYDLYARQRCCKTRENPSTLCNFAIKLNPNRSLGRMRIF